MKIALVIKYSHAFGQPGQTASVRLILDQKPHTLQDLEEEINKFNADEIQRAELQRTHSLIRLAKIQPPSSMKVEEIIELSPEAENPFGDVFDDLFTRPEILDGMVREIENAFTKIASAAYWKGSSHGHNEAVMEH